MPAKWLVAGTRWEDPSDQETPKESLISFRLKVLVFLVAFLVVNTLLADLLVLLLWNSIHNTITDPYPILNP